MCTTIIYRVNREEPSGYHVGFTHLSLMKVVGSDPTRHISHIYDNRTRIATRVKLLQSGYRYSQEPASPMRRLISNIEVEKTANGELVAGANFLLVELSIQAQHEMHLWAGRTTHKLRWVNEQLKMVEKKVVLVNAAEPIPNLSFLI